MSGSAEVRWRPGLFLGSFLRSINHPEHLDGQPKDTADARGGESGPDRDHKWIVGLHMGSQDRKLDGEKGEHQHGIDREAGGGDESLIRLAHDERERRRSWRVVDGISPEDSG